MLTLLTATGGRPVAWAICQRLMARQDYTGPVRWVIVDDGPEPQPMNFQRDGWELQVIRRAPYWEPGQNTQSRNLLAGLEAIQDDERVVVIEDDDYYAEDWLTCVSEQLSRAELVGECSARYYNVQARKARQMKNTRHASLCSTAMRGKALKTFRNACLLSPKFIDLVLWKRHPSRHLFGGHRVVGIKGLPGREGIGVGHRDDFNGTCDLDGALLEKWIGEDANLYV